MNRNWLAAVLLAVVVLLAGCGGPDAGPGADNETETETELVEDVTPTETELVEDVTPTETPGEAVTTGDVAVPRAPDVGATLLAGN